MASTGWTRPQGRCSGVSQQIRASWPEKREPSIAVNSPWMGDIRARVQSGQRVHGGDGKARIRQQGPYRTKIWTHFQNLLHGQALQQMHLKPLLARTLVGVIAKSLGPTGGRVECVVGCLFSLWHSPVA